MYLSDPLCAALDRISERAADVRRAFAPGAQPSFGDVASPEPGASSFTRDPLCAAPPGSAYFAVATARGTAYTRDGRFALRGDRLVDERGDAVLGTRARGDALAPLRIDPVDAALGRALDPRVEADGTLSYSRVAIDPRTGARERQRVVAGRLALARFPPGTRLQGDGVVLQPPEGVVAHTGAPADGSFAPLLPMHAARSGVDLDASLARLKDAYVAFDALQAAESAKGRTGKTAMELLK